MVKILNLPSTRQQIGAAFGQGIATGTQQLLQNLQQQKMQERQFEQQKELQRLKQEGKQPGFLQTPGGIQATAQLLQRQGFNQDDVQQIIQTGDEQLVRSVLKSSLAPSELSRIISEGRRFFGLGTSAGGVAPGGQGGIVNFLNQDPAQQQQQPQAQDGQPIDVARGTPMQELSRDLTALAPTATQAAFTQDTNAGAGSAAAAAGRPPGQVPTQFIDPLEQQVAPQGPVGVAPALAQPAAEQPGQQQQQLPQQPGLSPEQNEAINGQPLGPLVNTVLRPLGIARVPSQQEAEAILAERDAAKERAIARADLPLSEQVSQEMEESPSIRLAPSQSAAFLAQELGQSAIRGLTTLPSVTTKLLDIATYGKTPLWRASRYIDSIPGKIIPRTVESPSELDTRIADAAGFFTELSTGALAGGALANAFRGASGLGAVARNVGNFMNISPANALKLMGGRAGAKAAARWFGTSERGEEIAGLAGMVGISAFDLVRGFRGLRAEAEPLFDRLANAPGSNRIDISPVAKEIDGLSRELTALGRQPGITQVEPLFNQLESLARQGREVPVSEWAQLQRGWNNLSFSGENADGLSKFAKRVTQTLRDTTNKAAQAGRPFAETLQQADALTTLANSKSLTGQLWNRISPFGGRWRWGTMMMMRALGFPAFQFAGGALGGTAGLGALEFTTKAMLFDPTARSLASQAANGLVNSNARLVNRSLERMNRYWGRRAPTTIRNDRGQQTPVAFDLTRGIMVPARERS